MQNEFLYKFKIKTFTSLHEDSNSEFWFIIYYVKVLSFSLPLLRVEDALGAPPTATAVTGSEQSQVI